MPKAKIPGKPQNQNSVGNKGGAGPTSYKKEYNEQAYNLTLLGAKDADLARVFDVEERTIANWKTKYPEFLSSLKRGKDEADANVGKSLYQRAIGYSHPEDKIFINSKTGEPIIVPTIKHYPPDPTAMIFWLKNRQKLNWRDRQEITGADGEPITIIFKEDI